ncbi:MAG: HEAT repeat domain-containing protein, partial [Gemmataceae bacterium]
MYATAHSGARPARACFQVRLLVLVAFVLLTGHFRAVWGAPPPHAEAPKPDVSKLIKDLGHRDRKVRARAAKALGDLGTPAQEAVPALIDVLRDKEPEVKAPAAQALAQIGPAAIPALRRELGDEDSRVRPWAAIALGLMGPDGAKAVPDLLEVLKDKDAVLKVNAMRALGAIGPQARAAIPALTDLGKEKNPLVKLAAGVALQQITFDPRPGAVVEVADMLLLAGRNPRLTPKQEAQLDQLIELAVLFDTDQGVGVRGKELMRALGLTPAQVNALQPTVYNLGPEAVPALARGLFLYALPIGGSCPLMLTGRPLMKNILITTDVEALDYVLQLSRKVEPLYAGRPPLDYKKLSVQMIQELCLRRKAELQLMVLARKQAEE